MKQSVLLHLSLIDGVGSSAIQKIIASKSKKISWNDLYFFSVGDWVSFGISSSTAEKIMHGLSDKKRLDQEVSLLQKNEMMYVTLADEAYPALLREIHIPPPILYFKGVLPSDTARSIAFVGSRQANHYGKRVIDQLIPALVDHNITIVSGGAIGADSMAHSATLDAGGKTVVVLGSGLLKPYPYQNRVLFEKTVAMGGAVITPFSLQTSPLPGNFAARNRIIAGLSSGVVVVQAAHKSGTRITAQFALEQGRDVFAVPGLIDDPLSAGCHALIEQGAKLISNANDILQEYGLAVKIVAGKHQNKCLASCNRKDYDENSIENKIQQRCIQPQSIDELASMTEVSLDMLQLILFQMQIEGVIEQDFTGLWKTVKN